MGMVGRRVVAWVTWACNAQRYLIHRSLTIFMA